MTAIEELAAKADELNQEPLPEEIVHHAKRAVIDWYASLFPGLSTAPVRLLEQALAEDLDRGDARLALINGTAAHAAEVDDSFREAMYHPGAATIASALAAGQAAGIDGATFLRAVVTGHARADGTHGSGCGSGTRRGISRAACRTDRDRYSRWPLLQFPATQPQGRP